jgi:hypothetical protein
MFKGEIDRWFTDEPRWVDLTPSQLRKLEIIRTIRRCPIKATLTVLPCGFRRYDLPAGITEIAYTEPPPLTYEEAFGLVDADEDPETAPAAVRLSPAQPRGQQAKSSSLRASHRPRAHRRESPFGLPKVLFQCA